MKSILLGIRYPCDLFSYKSTTKGSIVGHKKLVHGNPKKLKCDFCEFETIKKYPQSELRRHKHLVHDNIQVFSCEQCEYKGLTRGLLGKHLKSHTISCCDQCDFSDKLKRNVRYHKISVHKDTLYYCDYCDFHTLPNIFLQEHIQAIHKMDKDLTLALKTRIRQKVRKQKEQNESAAS